MSIESLFATARLLIFTSLWAMMFALIPCCTFWMFVESAVPADWGNRLAPNVWIALWFLLQIFFAVLMLRAYLNPIACGAVGSVAYLPALLPAAAALWTKATGTRHWSLVDWLSLLPIVLHFGWVSATVVAYVTRPREPRLAAETEYDAGE